MVRGYLEGALNRDRNLGSRGGGSRWCRHEVGWVVDSKKVACHLFSACSEATETGKEKGIRVWHAMSRTVNNIDSSFLNGFYLLSPVRPSVTQVDHSKFQKLVKLVFRAMNKLLWYY